MRASADEPRQAGDRAPLVVDERLGRHEPEAEARLLGGDEGLEQPLAHLVADASPRVADAHDDRVAVTARVDRERAALGHRLVGVADEVEQRALHLPRVDEQRREVGDVDRDGDRRRQRELSERRIDQIAHGDGGELRLPHPRIVEQIGDEVVGADHLGVEDGERPGQIGVGRDDADLMLDDEGRVADGRERAADLVREAPCELAQHREPLLPHEASLRDLERPRALRDPRLEPLLRQAKLLLGGLEARDVVDDADQVRRRPLYVAQRHLRGRQHVVHAGCVGDRLLVDDDVGAGGEHLGVLAAEELGLARLEEIEVGVPDDLGARAPDERAERLVDQDEAERPILDEDRERDRLEHAGQELARPPGRRASGLPSAVVSSHRFPLDLTLVPRQRLGAKGRRAGAHPEVTRARERATRRLPRRRPRAPADRARCASPAPRAPCPGPPRSRA